MTRNRSNSGRLLALFLLAMPGIASCTKGSDAQPAQPPMEDPAEFMNRPDPNVPVTEAEDIGK